MPTNPSEPASPVRIDNTLYLGLSKREIIAALQLQGILASAPSAASKVEVGALMAVAAADALIAALNVGAKA